jgi:hypothetical protein
MQPVENKSRPSPLIDTHSGPGALRGEIEPFYLAHRCELKLAQLFEKKGPHHFLPGTHLQARTRHEN